jgi:hypothetical protein
VGDGGTVVERCLGMRALSGALASVRSARRSRACAGKLLAGGPGQIGVGIALGQLQSGWPRARSKWSWAALCMWTGPFNNFDCFSR